MKKFGLILLCGVLLLSATACGKTPEYKDPVLIEDSYPVQAVPNAVISRFITEYNASTDMDLHDYFRLTELNEYEAEAYECKVYITDNTDNADNPALRVTIMGGTTEEDRDRMFTVFAQMCSVLDTYASKTQINDTVFYLRDQTAPVSAYRFTGYLEVETYMPIIDIGTGVVDSRIDLVAYQYTAE